MARGCCTPVTTSGGGRLYFVDALGEPQDVDGLDVPPEDATHLLYDGETYVLQPGDVFLALTDVDGDNTAGSLWVVPDA